MSRYMRTALVAIMGLGAAASLAHAAAPTRTGTSAYGDWRSDAFGVLRKITAADLPAPLATPSVGNPPRVAPRPSGALPKVPDGFAVEALATGLDGPRVMRVAPNGDIFVSESKADRIRVLKAGAGAGQTTAMSVFAAGLERPFGIAFYPPGPDPQFVYVANTTSVVRFPYHNGDAQASAKAEVVVPVLPGGRGHGTRDIVFSPDGKTMLVSVGSGSNVAEGMPRWSAAQVESFAKDHALGASWDSEADRADVLAFDPDGKNKRVVATGIRNCVALATQPDSDALWCAVNERDGLGDDLVPDYVTSVKPGAFYGWPWYYIGDHEDPRLKGARPDLAGKITVPDVLIQPHSAPLGIAFYEGGQFPPQYKGDAFVALHGSWNRAKRTGYKVVRVVFKNGAPTGEYADFMDGFVTSDTSVWGRPVGTAVTQDGALLVSDDASGTIWRVTYKAE